MQLEGEVHLNLNLEGDPSNIGRVIEALESMPRITEVQEISVSFNVREDILVVVKILVVGDGGKI